MKKIIILFIILFVLSVSLYLVFRCDLSSKIKGLNCRKTSADAPCSLNAKIANTGFTKSDITQNKEKDFYALKKEKFRYGIYLTGFKIGESTISFEGIKELNGRDVVFITMESKAPSFYDYEEIYGSVDDFTPLLVKRKVRMLGEDIQITEEYDQENKKVTITRKSKETKVQTISSEKQLNNIILFLFYLRTKKRLEIGEKIAFNLPTKSLEMVISKTTSIKTPKGRFEAYYLESSPSKYRAWFSSDEDLIPLRIDGAVGFGNTRLVIIE